MKWLVGCLFLACTAVHAQDSRGVDIVGHWHTEGLPLNGSGAFYNEVWGFVVDGQEYGVIGSTLGHHIIHLKGNGNLEEAAFVAGTQQGDHVVHRDYASYGNYLLTVGDQGPAKLQIIDVSGLPESVEVVYESSEYMTTAHNIFVDEPASRAYVCGTNEYALEIFDISNPTAPVHLLEFEGVSYVHDCYVRGDTAWLNTGNPGLAVVDFSDVSSPEFLGTLDEYPDDGYNHSGWLDPSGQWYCFADETMESSIKLCDVSDLTDINITDFFDSGGNTFIPHNVIIKDHLIYVSHYFHGLQIFDWSDPYDVKRVAWYDTSLGEDACCLGAWGVYPLLPSGRILLSDRQRGLFLFQMETPNREFNIQVSPNPANASVEVSLMDWGFDWHAAEVQVYNSNGRLVEQRTVLNPGNYAHWFKLDTRAWAPGMYVVEVIRGDRVSRARLMKI